MQVPNLVAGVQMDHLQPLQMKHHKMVGASVGAAEFVGVAAQPIMCAEVQQVQIGIGCVGAEKVALEVLIVEAVEIPLILLQEKRDLLMNCLASFLYCDRMGI